MTNAQHTNVNHGLINQSVERRSNRNQYYRSDFSDNTFMSKNNPNDLRIEIKLNFDRSLNADDLKMLYLISEY